VSRADLLRPDAAPAAAATDRPEAPRDRRSLVLEAATYVSAALATVVATVAGLQLWRADLRVPFQYQGDAIAVSAHIKTVLETGWYEFQPLLGFPAGQTYHDFPTADNLNFVFARVLGWFTSDWAVALNAYYLLGFPLAALAGVWFLREAGLTRSMSAVLAALFALAPYHFTRGESHLWLASYFTLPLAMVVVLRALRGEPLWGGGRGPRFVRLLTGRGASTVVCLALVATASSYYAVFVLILLAAAGAGAWLRDRRAARFLGAAGAGVVAVVVVLLNMLPDILYTRAHGESAAGFVRDPAEVEIYALKLAQLLLPVPGHRVPVLAALRQRYDSTYPLISEQPALGAVAAAGFVAAMLVVAYTLVLRGRRDALLPPEQVRRSTTIAHLSMLTFVAFLWSTVGGLATFLSFVTASLRGWNRMSIVIALLCLAVIGLVLDAAVARLGRWACARGLRPSVRRAVAWCLAGGVLLVGCADQVTPGAVPRYEETTAAFDADARWIGQVEDALPDDAAVFQLPYLAFPETVPGTEQLRAYLHSPTLRWSGGAIQGRATTDWSRGVAELDPTEMVDDLVAAGFSGVLLDRVAYGDGAAEVEAGLAQAAGPAVTQSEDGRYVLFSLVDEAEAAAADTPAADLATLRESVVEPVTVYPGTGSAAVELPDGTQGWAVAAGGSSLVLENPRDEPVEVRVTAQVAAPTAGSVAFEAGERTWTVGTGSGAGALDVALTVPPGRSELVVRPDGGAEGVVLGDLRVAEADLPALRR
jgi:phosphoglycerol transferase